MTPGRLHRLGLRVRSTLRDRRSVVVVALALVVAQLVVRTWAIGGGWFLGEDLGRLADATGGLSLESLGAVRRDHLEPVGVALTWLLAQAAPYDWATAAGILVGLQALADLAALGFVFRLVGVRWVALVPLGWYLFAAGTLPGVMWWSAATLQLPLQVAAFVAMACHVEYVRTRRLRFAGFALLAVVVGLASDVGGVYVVVPLVFLSLYLSDATGVRGRLVDGLWRQRMAWLGYLAVLAGYAATYLARNPLEPRPTADGQQVLSLLVRDSLVPALFGGPWRWGSAEASPLVPSEAPQGLVVASWVLLLVVVLLAWWRRRAVVWALLPVEVVVVVHALAIAYARGSFPAEVLAWEVRYLGDLAPVTTLALAVLAASLPARRSAEPEPEPVVAPARGVVRRLAVPALATAVMGVFVAGSVVSTTGYAAGWHGDFPARTYVGNVLLQSRLAPLRVLDQQVPAEVAAPVFGAPELTRPSGLFRPLGAGLLATLEGNDPDVLDSEGLARPAQVRPLVSSADAPAGECGFRVAELSVDIPLAPVSDDAPAPALWWASIAYLASADGRVGVAVGDQVRNIPVRRGLHTYVFLGSGTPGGSARLVALSDTVLCVDVVALGVLDVAEDED